MARMIIKDGTTWQQAQADAAKVGIILTKRPHSKGGFVCFASEQLRDSLQQVLSLKQLPHPISGKL